MEAEPVSVSGKRGSGRRLSWADEAGQVVVPLVEPVPDPDGEVEAAAEPDAEGVLIVYFGIIRLGSLYGVTACLPQGTTAAEVIQPLPEGLTAEVRPIDGDAGGTLGLFLTFERNAEGRERLSFGVRLEGCAGAPELEVRVEANVIGLRADRPSRTHHDVQLLRGKQGKALAADNEGAEWKKAAADMEKDPEVADAS